MRAPFVAAALALSFTLSGWTHGGGAVSPPQPTPTPTLGVYVNPSLTGATIPTNFVGLSYGIGVISSDSPGIVGNTALANILSVLGGKCTVRFGANEVDTETEPLLAYSSGLNAAKAICGSNYQIWNVAGKIISPNTTYAQQGATDAAEVAQLLGTSGAPALYFPIGNEPDLYSGGSFSTYQSMWNTIQPIITASSAAANFVGPDNAGIGSISSYLVPYSVNMGSASSFYTFHCYAGAESGNEYNDLTNALASSGCWNYVSNIAGNIATGGGVALPLHIDEAGSFEGSYGEGNTLGGALFDVKMMMYLAANGFSGVNFLGGLSSPSGNGGQTYSPVVTLDGGVTYTPQATLYAMLAFQQVAGCAIAAFDKHTVNSGVGSVLATQCAGPTKVLVTNESLTAAETITVTSSVTPSTASALELAASSYASASVTLGGATVSASGAWSPTPISLTISGNSVSLSLCAACAVVVTMQ